MERITPEDGHYVHTYFDVCPFSPSQKYLAVTKLPGHDVLPRLGDTADVCIIDLVSKAVRTVYTTRSWGYQTGAHAQWADSDRYLYVNDVVDDQAVCVRIDLEDQGIMRFAGPMYHLAQDASCVVGFPLELLDATQKGYGVPPGYPGRHATLPQGASTTEGVWRTNLRTNEKSLICSIADLAVRIPESAPEKDGTFYCWHTKLNRQGTRIMQVLRCILPANPDAWNTMVFTMNLAGGEIFFTPKSVRAPVWGAGGGHPNWHPDGVHLIRHMRLDGRDMPVFVQMRYDGTGLQVLSDTIPGGGHPSIESTGRYLVTDERFRCRDGQAGIRIRLIDLNKQKEYTLCWMPTLDVDKMDDDMFRLDGHPVWSRDGKRLCFQAAPEGVRQIFLADWEECLRGGLPKGSMMARDRQGGMT